MAHKTPAPEKGPPSEQDWVFLDDEAAARQKKQMDLLKMQVEVYRDDYYQERRLREKAEAETVTLQQEMSTLRETLVKKEEELQYYKQQVEHTADDKLAIMRKTDERNGEVQLLRQQVATLQERLRELEQERRHSMYPELFPAPVEWNCRMCTYQNPASARHCEMCHEPAPERRPPPGDMSSYIVCD